MKELGAGHYNKIYSARPYPAEIYDEIYKAAAGHCAGRVLDLGCGTGRLRQHLPAGCAYTGVDFAGAALDAGLVLGDIYTTPVEAYDTYVLLEVLEHVDADKVLGRLPEGRGLVVSVPSFMCAGHLRPYPADKLAAMLGPHMAIEGLAYYSRHRRGLYALTGAPPAAGRYITLLHGSTRG